MPSNQDLIDIAASIDEIRNEATGVRNRLVQLAEAVRGYADKEVEQPAEGEQAEGQTEEQAKGKDDLWGDLAWVLQGTWDQRARKISGLDYDPDDELTGEQLETGDFVWQSGQDRKFIKPENGATTLLVFEGFFDGADSLVVEDSEVKSYESWEVCDGRQWGRVWFFDLHIDGAHRAANRVYGVKECDFWNIREDCFRGVSIIDGAVVYSHGTPVEGAHSDTWQQTESMRTTGFIIHDLTMVEGSFQKAMGFNGGSVSNGYIGECYFDNRNPENGHFVFTLNSDHENILVEDTVIRGKIGTGGTFKNVIFHNVGVDDLSKLDRPGITVIDCYENEADDE